MYVKHNLWTKGQVVIVIAGSGRNETAAAHKMYVENVERQVTSSKNLI
jgi:hypothetical protein